MVHKRDTTINIPTSKPPRLEGWRERIDKAEKKGKFLVRDTHAATSWMKCACGERAKLDEEVDSTIWEDKYGEMMTPRANKLGGRFPSCIPDPRVNTRLTSADIKMARDTLKKIERMRHLIKKKYRIEPPAEKREKKLRKSMEPL